MEVKYKVNEGGYDVTIDESKMSFTVFAAKKAVLWPRTACEVETNVCIEFPKGYIGVISIDKALASDRYITIPEIFADTDINTPLSITMLNNGNVKTTVEAGDKIATISLIKEYVIDLVKNEKEE